MSSWSEPGSAPVLDWTAIILGRLLVPCLGPGLPLTRKGLLKAICSGLRELVDDVEAPPTPSLDLS